ncbi:MAG: hypothetical protein FJ138_00955, partial [Deltaproteobacteria bacterium]|nr:hypothetical protein [Deltaproteobacteria bacterium]
MRPRRPAPRALSALNALNALSVLSVLSVLSGCNTPCVLNTQCSSEEVCRAGACRKSCVAYYDCADGEACYEGACAPPPEGFCATQAATGEGGEAPARPLCAPEDLPDM